jgi:hypothetical protein
MTRAESKTLGQDKHTIEAGLITPLNRIIEHRLVGHWEKSLRQIFGAREGIEGSSGTTENDGLKAVGRI